MHAKRAVAHERQAFCSMAARALMLCVMKQLGVSASAMASLDTEGMRNLSLSEELWYARARVSGRIVCVCARASHCVTKRSIGRGQQHSVNP